MDIKSETLDVAPTAEELHEMQRRINNLVPFERMEINRAEARLLERAIQTLSSPIVRAAVEARRNMTDSSVFGRYSALVENAQGERFTVSVDRA